MIVRYWCNKSDNWGKAEGAGASCEVISKCSKGTLGLWANNYSNDAHLS